MSTITLFVNRVRCADETTGKYREKFGNDEIYLGAVYVGISADRSFDVRVVRTKEVYADFDDKETIEWNRPLFTFELGDPLVHPFPKAAIASLVLAEHDSGNGRNDFLDTVAQQFRAKLTEQAIDGVATAALRAAGVQPPGRHPGGVLSGGLSDVVLGRLDEGVADPSAVVMAATATGTVVRDHRGESGGSPRPTRPRPRRTGGDTSGAPPVVRDHRDPPGASGAPANVLGMPADGIVVEGLKDWAKDEIGKIISAAIKKASGWVGDDVFPPALKVLQIPSADHTFGGSPDTSEEVAEFVGHDGKYHVWTQWQLRA